MFKISQAKKKEGKYCCAYHCSNDPVVKKGGLCHKHYARKIREEDPVYARFNQAKGKAKSRGISWEITLEEFREFCNRTGYIVRPGHRGYSATLDRIKNSIGYRIDNIQLKSNRYNAKKGNRYDDEYPF